MVPGYISVSLLEWEGVQPGETKHVCLLWPKIKIADPSYFIGKKYF
jgi:hypothetical protein